MHVQSSLVWNNTHSARSQRIYKPHLRRYSSSSVQTHHPPHSIPPPGRNNNNISLSETQLYLPKHITRQHTQHDCDIPLTPSFIIITIILLTSNSTNPTASQIHAYTKRNAETHRSRIHQHHEGVSRRLAETDSDLRGHHVSPIANGSRFPESAPVDCRSSTTGIWRTRRSVPSSTRWTGIQMRRKRGRGLNIGL